jgi:retron-type reverse transcriptase
MDNKKISYQNIVSVENLLAAWHEFRKGKRNKKDIQEFQLHLMDNILDLHDELVCKTYEHGGYEEFHISDPKPRVIHKANVRDRVLHHAVYRILYPYADRKFIFDSYSCRNGKGHHRAIKRFQKFVRKVSENYTKKCWVLQCDIKKFFANIDHNVLNTEIEKYTDDEDVLAYDEDKAYEADNAYDEDIEGDEGA